MLFNDKINFNLLSIIYAKIINSYKFSGQLEEVNNFTLHNVSQLSPNRSPNCQKAALTQGQNSRHLDISPSRWINYAMCQNAGRIQKCNQNINTCSKYWYMLLQILDISGKILIISCFFERSKCDLVCYVSKTANKQTNYRHKKL